MAILWHNERVTEEWRSYGWKWIILSPILPWYRTGILIHPFIMCCSHKRSIAITCRRYSNNSHCAINGWELRGGNIWNESNTGPVCRSGWCHLLATRWRVYRFLCQPAYCFDGQEIWYMYKAVSTEVNSAYNKISQKSRCRINTTITQWSVFCLGRFCRAWRPAPFWWRPALFKKLKWRPALLTIFFYYRTKCALFKWHPALLKTWAEHWWCVEIIWQRSFQRDQHLFHLL